MTLRHLCNQRVLQHQTRLVVGIDPHWHYFEPCHFEAVGLKPSAAPGIFLPRFYAEFIRICAPFAAAFKPQMAFFEQFGMEGFTALAAIMTKLRALDIPIILDGKRNDIASTAEAYARAYFSKNADFECDALTVNPYLGEDGLLPFLTHQDKGIFVLLKTSNPGSGLIQDQLLTQGKPLYHFLAQKLKDLGHKHHCGDNLGVVIGATYPEILSHLRQELQDTLFLIPGFGAQGGDPQGLRAAFNPGGTDALINASRSINFPKSFRQKGFEAIAEAARDHRDQLNEVANA
jgi:orotidine-5'-phosphate decarboxylase